MIHPGSIERASWGAPKHATHGETMKDIPKGSSARGGDSFSAKPKGPGFPLWLLVLIIPFGGVFLCCCGGILILSLKSAPLTANVPPTLATDLSNYKLRVERSVRGQQFEPLKANATCQLTNHFAVRDLPGFLAIHVTTDDGGAATVICRTNSAAASLLRIAE